MNFAENTSLCNTNASLDNVVFLSNQYVPAKTETRIWMPQKPWCSGPPLDCHQHFYAVRPMVGPVVSALIFSNTWQHVAVLSPVPWLAAWKVFCHPKGRVANLQPINQLYNRYPSAISVGRNSSRATGNFPSVLLENVWLQMVDTYGPYKICRIPSWFTRVYLREHDEENKDLKKLFNDFRPSILCFIHWRRNRSS